MCAKDLEKEKVIRNSKRNDSRENTKSELEEKSGKKVKSEKNKKRKANFHHSHSMQTNLSCKIQIMHIQEFRLDLDLIFCWFFCSNNK